MPAKRGIYIFVPEVQRVLGWTSNDPAKHRLLYKRTVRWLHRRNLIVKRCGRWVTTRDLLIEELPEVWAELAQDATELECR